MNLLTGIRKINAMLQNTRGTSVNLKKCLKSYVK